MNWLRRIIEYLYRYFEEKPYKEYEALAVMPGEIEEEALRWPCYMPDIKFWDSNYYAVKTEDWAEIIADTIFNMPAYVKDKFDCEDFALLFAARVLERYQINTCAVAIGQSPYGYHGFNIFFAWEGGERGLRGYILEPQTGEIWSFDDSSGYEPDLILIG